MENKKRKIPGTLYILVSFIPWIVYWILLCGMGNAFGIIIPLAISLLFIISQVPKKEFNLKGIIKDKHCSLALLLLPADKVELIY